MLTELLNKRNLPELKSRSEMLEILQSEVYGYIPRKPDLIEFEVKTDIVKNFCAGKAHLNKIIAHCKIDGDDFSFPFYATLPTAAGKHPFFVHINFRDAVPDRYMPSEELIDAGFAVFSFCYEDVTHDNADFSDGLAGILYKNEKRPSSGAGKIAMWAWAAHRVMDHAKTLTDVLDLSSAVVCGHSRLGKTALLAAATDERFAYAYSNDSGCTGAALTRGKSGERIRDIMAKFPYWFCENYKKYIDKEETMPHDQHFLISSIAPRKVLIGSAAEDAWADPISEFLCCIAASSAFDNGFICDNRLPEIGDKFFSGDLGYHLRTGTHYFSREDWNRLIDFIRSKQ